MSICVYMLHIHIYNINYDAFYISKEKEDYILNFFQLSVM